MQYGLFFWEYSLPVAIQDPTNKPPLKPSRPAWLYEAMRKWSVCTTIIEIKFDRFY
jgi:hypothetical protein